MFSFQKFLKRIKKERQIILLCVAYCFSTLLHKHEDGLNANKNRSEGNKIHCFLQYDSLKSQLACVNAMRLFRLLATTILKVACNELIILLSCIFSIKLQLYICNKIIFGYMSM